MDQHSASKADEYSSINQTIDVSLLNSKQINDYIDKSQVFRTQSSKRWIILLIVGFSWASTTFCTFSPAILETSLINHYNWTSLEYSNFISVAFIAAIFMPLLMPYFLSQYHPILVYFLILFLAFIGQWLMIIGILFSELEYILYIARVFIGLANSGSDSLAMYFLIFWFGKSKESAIASCIILSGLETGIVIARLILSPLSNIIGLAWSFISGIVFLFIAGMLLTFWYYYERNWLKSDSTVPVYVTQFYYTYKYEHLITSKEDTKDTEAELETYDENTTLLPSSEMKETANNKIETASDTDASSSSIRRFIGATKEFPQETWLILLHFCVQVGFMVSINSCITEPLVKLYDMDEYTADLLWAITSAMVAIFSFCTGHLMDVLGYYVQFNIGAFLIVLLATLLIAFGSFVDSSSGSIVIAIIAVVLFAVGLLFLPSVFAMQSNTAPMKYIHYISSMGTMGFWFFSVVFSDIFGLIETLTGSYVYSLIFLACVIFYDVFNGFIILVVSKSKGLTIHQSNKG